MILHKSKKDIFNVVVRKIDIIDWENLVVVLNEYEANLHGINQFDKVSIIFNWHKIVVDVALSADIVSVWEVGVFEDVYEKYNISEWDSVWVYFVSRRDISVEAIKKEWGEKI